MKLAYSDDLKTWVDVEAPKYTDGLLVGEKPASNQLMWSFAAPSNAQPDRFYIGTEPGGLFVTDDNGQSFQLVEGLWNHPSRKNWFGGGRDNAAIHSIWVDPTNDDRILVAVSCGGVFETVDGGENWEPRNSGLFADFLPDPHAEVGQDPHIISVSPVDSNRIWQQNHCGVYRSDDGAKTWNDVSTDDKRVYFGFPIATSDTDPDTAWVVPGLSDEIRTTIDGALFVARTSDAGKTWQEFTAGLPQKGCYDIVFRHALITRGDALVFGTTNGNLYHSKDGGESWAIPSTTLPPIYNVSQLN